MFSPCTYLHGKPRGQEHDSDDVERLVDVRGTEPAVEESLLPEEEHQLLHRPAAVDHPVRDHRDRQRDEPLDRRSVMQQTCQTNCEEHTPVVRDHVSDVRTDRLEPVVLFLVVSRLEEFLGHLPLGHGVRLEDVVSHVVAGEQSRGESTVGGQVDLDAVHLDDGENRTADPDKPDHGSLDVE
jgi:hypothetical protein